MPNQTPAVESSHPPAAVLRVVNPVMRMLLHTPLGGRLRKEFMVLRFTGRTSGRGYQVPVTAHRSGGELYALTAAPWRLNFRGGRDVDVVLDGKTTAMRGDLTDDPKTAAETYARRITELGPKRAQRDLGLKINVPRAPTVEELTQAAEHEHLSVIHLTSR
jgi:hypothetical protein